MPAVPTAVAFRFHAVWESCAADRHYLVTAVAETTPADVLAMVKAPDLCNTRTIRLPHGGHGRRPSAAPPGIHGAL